MTTTPEAEFAPDLRWAEPVRTFDDLHESEQLDLVQRAAAELAPTADRPAGHFFAGSDLAERRRAVARYDYEALPAVKRAIRTVRETAWFLSWLPGARQARADLVDFAFAVTEKIEAEDYTGLEQFGPVKRAVAEALLDR